MTAVAMGMGGGMEDANKGRIWVSATIENLADILEVGRGLRAASSVRRLEIADAVVDPDIFGLLMPLRLVEELGLEPVRTRWVRKLLEAGRPLDPVRPVPHRSVVLKVQDRDCTMEVGAVADHHPVVIGSFALHAMNWVVDLQVRRLIGNPEHGGEEMVDLF